MKTYDDLNNQRNLISKILKKESGGEVNEFDFIVNFLTRPVEVTFMLGVSDKSSFKLNKYKDFLENLLTALGYPSKLFSNVDYIII